MTDTSSNTYTLHHGDCLDVLRGMADASVDSVVTDPPYGLSFMGRKWDYDVPSVEIWAECLRVLKPGGHLLAFAGTRTQHRMAVRIEDAGFEIRDMLAWLYSTGFPKSLDVSKAIDKAAGVEREVVGDIPDRWTGKGNALNFSTDRPQERVQVLGGPATEAAKQWQGWGTALKPALEPITMARKPLAGTVAVNVLAHGTGGLNIDGGRIPTDDKLGGGDQSTSTKTKPEGWDRPWMQDATAKAAHADRVNANVEKAESMGRWPANLLHDGSPEVVERFPHTAASKSGGTTRKTALGRMNDDGWVPKDTPRGGFDDAGGSAARFFYCAKASRKDRGEGNTHCTVKPTALMRYLCRLVTPPGGVVFDPFTGSGSTGKAAVLEGFRFIGAEREAEYVAIARARIAAATQP